MSDIPANFWRGCFLFFFLKKGPEKIVIGIKITTFVRSNHYNIKRYKVKEIIKMLEADGWFLSCWRGDHRQFKHTTKKGRVTVPGKPSDTLEQEILNSIFKQAGWR